MRTILRRRRVTGAVCAVVCAGVLGGCAGSGPSVDASGAGAGAAAGTCPSRPVRVVVTVDQWGDVVNRLAGACGRVTTIFKSSSADPHDYEPTPADTAEFDGAALVVLNGLDYDPWAEKAIAAVGGRPVVLNAGEVVGLRTGDNPHIWYGPEFVDKVADAVTAALVRVEPRDATYFHRANEGWKLSMRRYRAEVARVKRSATGKTYGSTEGIFDYMAAALGMRNATPTGYQRAAANGSEPAPGDLQAFEQSLGSGSMSVLIFNTQTEGAIPEQLRSRAEAARVPVVDVTESVPAKYSSFDDWQVSQLRDLAAALAS